MTDQMPDFDSMSPEELMAWMESLAKRQGAHEGFTTAADMQVAEIDPNLVSVDEPGYIPYGMDTEKWELKKAEEERRKQERLSQMSTPPAPAPIQQAPPPAPTPVPQAPPPAPEPVKAQAADATPDFDNMTPEQLMLWMESLAKRQGADEGLTTAANMQVAEVDAASVHLDEPGYIPYGMDAATWERKQEQERQRKESRRAQAQQPAQQTPPPAPAPVPQAPPPAPEPEPSFEFEESSFDFDFDETVKGEPVAQGDDPLSWLESIAAGSTADTPQLDFDFSALNELGQAPAAAAAAPTDDPLAWLESLSQSGDDLAGLAQFSLDNLADSPPAQQTPPPAPKTVSAPEPTDTLEWLESLAKRQGASEEELVTSASIDIPIPSQTASDAPGYTDFSIDNNTNLSQGEFDFELELPIDESAFDVDTLDSDSDNDWLSALASGQIEPNMPPFVDENAAEKEEAPPKEILSRLEQGQNISSDEMADWMSNLLEHGAKRNVPDYIDEEDESDSLEQSELPDWLLQQVGTPPAGEAASPAPLTEDIIEPPAPDMPEWLRDSFEEEAEELSFDSIFADEIEQGAVITDEHDAVEFESEPIEELPVNADDPWVEAFEEERRAGDDIPEWYRERLQMVSGGTLEDMPEMPIGAPLPAAALPDEQELSLGELQDLPDWLDIEAAPAAPMVIEASAEPVSAIEQGSLDDMPAWLKQQITSEQPAAEDIPDWLKEAGIEEVAVEEVPDWLLETAPEEAVTPTPAPQVIPTPAPTPAPQPKPAVSPAPVVMVTAAADVTHALNEARSKARAGEIDSALVSYEAVVRANDGLDAVVADLTTMLGDEKLKKNPAIYRVLGDGLMRQGQLQQALDTYRKALNLL